MNPRKAAVCIIGGGIFGATAALILGESFRVHLFESQADILGGASFANQYRHHMGYHYPRSVKTIQEIKDATEDFEAWYGSVLDRSVPSFYCVNKSGSLTTPEEFLQVCQEMGLPYRIEYPHQDFLNRKTVALCVRTPEAVYDYAKLKSLIRERIAQNGNIALHCGSEVVGARFSGDSKVLCVREGNATREYTFEYCINATYARYNTFCRWFQFPMRTLEYRFKEVLMLQISHTKRAAVTIMDGPFATLVPVGNSPNLYTLGDVPLSVHGSITRKEAAAVDSWEQPKSRYREILQRCSGWFPLLGTSEYVSSMFIVLPIEANDSTDARPTDLTYHGRGCWSILGGKIITAVTTAKKIRKEIQRLELSE